MIFNSGSCVPSPTCQSSVLLIIDLWFFLREQTSIHQKWPQRQSWSSWQKSVSYTLLQLLNLSFSFMNQVKMQLRRSWKTHTTEIPSDAFKVQLKSDNCRVFAAPVSQHIYFTWPGDASGFKKGSPVQRSRSASERDETCLDGARRPTPSCFYHKQKQHRLQLFTCLLCPGHSS